MQEDELDVSPMAGMTAPNVEESLVPIVPDETLTLLLKARSGKSLTDLRDTALLRVFLDTGCRFAEVTNLRQGDVDTGSQKLRRSRQGLPPPGRPLRCEHGIGARRYLASWNASSPSASVPPALWIGRQADVYERDHERPSPQCTTPVSHGSLAPAAPPFAHVWLSEGGNEGDLMSIAGWRSRSMLTATPSPPRWSGHTAHTGRCPWGIGSRHHI